MKKTAAALVLASAALALTACTGGGSTSGAAASPSGSSLKASPVANVNLAELKVATITDTKPKSCGLAMMGNELAIKLSLLQTGTADYSTHTDCVTTTSAVPIQHVSKLKEDENGQYVTLTGDDLSNYRTELLKSGGQQVAITLGGDLVATFQVQADPGESPVLPFAKLTDEQKQKLAKLAA